MQHGLSIDVEDYNQIILKDYFSIDAEPSPEVERNTQWLLDFLSGKCAQATFFVLGNVAQRFPNLIRRMADEGHEIGVHGYDHRQIFTMSPQEFSSGIKNAKQIIEDCSGRQVAGHRAPAFSITEASGWALDILAEAGFIYDSSIYPINGRRYGIEHAEKSVHRLSNGLYEIPLSCITLWGTTLPIAGGGYFRHFPYWWTKWAVTYNARIGRPGVVYLHPYEFELAPPAIDAAGAPLPFRRRYALFIHNLLQSHNRGARQRQKFTALLSDFSVCPLRRLLPEIP
jgi:polysaccharide deacetylase family protein (PEP-CTERM system associated)